MGQAARSAAMISRAKEKHWPQRGLRRGCDRRWSGRRRRRAPPARTSLSQIALQTQTIMEIGYSDNASCSQ